MKRYSWIFALILALTMVFIFTGCPEESKTTPTPTPVTPPPPGPGPTPPGPGPNGPNLPEVGGDTFKITLVDGDTETVLDGIEALADNGEVEFFEDESGYKYTYADGIKYSRGAVRFKVTLPDGEKLGDYETITATVTGISGDVGLAPEAHPEYTKNLFILASDDEDDLMGTNKGDSVIKGQVVNTLYFESNPDGALYAGEAEVPKVVGPDSQDIETPILRKKNLTGDVWISFYFHAEDGSYAIQDIKFIKREGEEAFVPVTNVTYNGQTIGITGSAITLSGLVTPPDATNKDIVWTTSTANASIADGKLTATAAGKVTLTATITDGTAVGTDKVVTLTNAIEIFAKAETLAGVAVTGVADVTTTTVSLPAGDGGLIATDPAGGFTVFITASYGHAAYFAVDLGSDTLGDYEKVTISFKGISGDLTYKNIFLLAAATEDGIKDFSNVKTMIANSDNTDTSKELYDGAWGVPGTGNSWSTASTKDLAIKAQKSLTGTVYFSIYLHNDPYVATIDSITFVK